MTVVAPMKYHSVCLLHKHNSEINMQGHKISKICFRNASRWVLCLLQLLYPFTNEMFHENGYHYVCGATMFKSQRRDFILLVKKSFELYFGRKTDD
jgi:hypothetical protein